MWAKGCSSGNWVPGILDGGVAGPHFKGQPQPRLKGTVFRGPEMKKPRLGGAFIGEELLSRACDG